MRLMVYKNHELQDIIYDYNMLKFSRKFRGTGEFYLSVPTLDYADSFEIGNIATVHDDAYFITGVRKYKDLADRMVFEVRGKHVNSLLARRVLLSSYSFTPQQTYEWHIQQLLQTHAISPVNGDRRIPALEMRLYNWPHTPTTAYKAERMTLEQVINTACGYAGVGYRLGYDPDGKKFVFELRVGADKTQDIVFSEEFGNVANTEINRDVSERVTVCYLDNNGAITPHGSGAGLDRIESMVQGDNSGAALEELHRRTAKETVTTDILQTEQFDYRIDWNLGDTVTFLDKKMGFMVEKPVLEITEIYGKTFDLEVVFGERKPLFLV